MPSGCYRFSRSDRSIEGFFSTNTASTDAINALSAWARTATERTYEVITDEDEFLNARLHWSEIDKNAGPDLDDACRKVGVQREFEAS